MSSTTSEDGGYKLPGFDYDSNGIPSQGYYNPDLGDEDDLTSLMMTTAPEHNVVVVGVLIALIIILCLILGCVTIPPILALIQRQLPVPQARIDRRYATIDGWLITKKIQPHDEVCECVRQHYSVEKQVSPPPNSTDEVCQPALSSSTSSNTSSSSSVSVDVVSQEENPRRPTKVVDDSQPHTEASSEPIEIETTDSSEVMKGTKSQKTKKKMCVLTTAVLLEKLAPAEDQEENEHGERSNLDDTAAAAASAAEHVSPSLCSTSSSLYDDSREEEEDESPGCAICMEAFRVHDKVSWSTNAACGHIFHHECLREWLLRKIACPCCRQIILAVDRPIEDNARLVRRRLSSNELATYARERVHRTSTTYYCIEDGLITLHGFGSKGTDSPLQSVVGEEDADLFPHNKPHSTLQRPWRQFWRRRTRSRNRTAQADDGILPMTRSSTPATLPSTPTTLRYNGTFMDDAFSNSSICCSCDDIESGIMDTSERSIGLVFGSDDSEGGSCAEEPLESSVNSSRSEEPPETSPVLGSPHDIQENSSAEETIVRLSSIMMGVKEWVL